jgi:GNAT superfamily N-acetyltransferase
MGQRLDQAELRRRAIEGVREEVTAFGGGGPGSRLIRRDGLLAAVAPATPKRSLFNSVFFTEAAVLAAELDGLASTYENAGVCAWTVWVPDSEPASAELLASRGHVLDAAPRAMAIELVDLGPVPPPPVGIEVGPGDAASAALLNDLAYGYGPDGFRAGLAEDTSIHWHAAHQGEEQVSCVGEIRVGDDSVITGIATAPEHQRRGIAGWLLGRVLEEARAAGMRSASLQATRAGAPLYERMGFADHGFIEMWELRREQGGGA